MCGIVGFAGQRKSAEALAATVDALAHRGPDGAGSRFFPEEDVFLGHRRLAVLDLSDAGAQPMSAADGQVWLTYNGEIYNFRELREELEKVGCTFHTQCDTEVLLALYLERGPDFVRDLNGIFALAILDRRKNEILLARDHLGVKPLYYSTHGGRLSFASEIKAILTADVVPRDVDWQAIYDYFTYLYVPCPHSAFEAIRQLPPAHTLTFDLKTGDTTLAEYWNPVTEAAKLQLDGNYADRMRALLEDSVRLQMVSDVPLGVFLSGGIDSATLTALAARQTGQKLKTFTIVFEGEGIAPYDEREGAERVSRHVGTDHREISVRVHDPEEVFELGRHFDQPFANPTFYLSYLVSKATKEYVTVALSGAGGDELFGGYPRYRVLGYAPLLSKVPRSLGRGIASLAGRIPEVEDRPTARRIKLLMRGLGQPLPEQYLRWTYFFSDAQKQTLVAPLLGRHPSLSPSVRLMEQALAAAPDSDLLAQIQSLDYKTFLLDNILAYTDITSMAVGLESRVPFLDPRLVALSLRIPPEEKIRGSKTKAILRDAYPDLLPESVLRAPKQGFCPPISEWMRTHFDRYFDERLTPDRVASDGIFDHAAIQRIRAEHKAGRRDNSMELFGILVFDSWFRDHVS